MADLVQDAAIITLAERIMNDDGNGWMSVDAFTKRYGTTAGVWKQILDTLFLYGLIYEKYEKDKWALEGEYVYKWKNEE